MINSIKVHVYLPDHYVALLHHQAARKGLTFSEVTRRVLEKGFEASLPEAERDLAAACEAVETLTRLAPEGVDPTLLAQAQAALQRHQTLLRSTQEP